MNLQNASILAVIDLSETQLPWALVLLSVSMETRIEIKSV